jgi:[acyl-carrier-protein] S-malonyltransferase
MKTAILFPAFVSEYSGSEKETLSRHPNSFWSLLGLASEILDADLTGFDFSGNNFLEDELKSQYVSYIYSCAITDILHAHRVSPVLVTGYSMGLYSALYYCGTVSFQDGLLLIKKAWEAISRSVPHGGYGMGMVIGLTVADLSAMIDGPGLAWICNRNNEHTYIISGEMTAISRILAAAKAEGALRTNLLPASKPYHTPFLEHTGNEFSAFLSSEPFMSPQFDYLSSLTREVITSSEGMRREAVANLYHEMNWYETMKHLLNSGVDTFLECGAGDGLTRNFRFIDSSVSAFSVAKLDQFLERVR